MRRNLLLVLLVFSLVFFLSNLGSADHYYLSARHIHLGPADSTAEVDIGVYFTDTVNTFIVPLYAEGTSNPVLDTALTGGLGDVTPPGFSAPSLVSSFSQKTVNPYGPPDDPIYFLAIDSGMGGLIPPQSGLFCRMFYRVSGSGTLTFRTAVHSQMGQVRMSGPHGDVPINWPAEGQVDSFEVTIGIVDEYSLVPVDLQVCSGCDSTIQVNVNIKTVDPRIEALVLPLFAEGTCNPVLDTVLTGGLSDANPPAFSPPSLADHFTQRIVHPYGPPVDPMLFIVFTTDGGIIYPTEGLYCRMFYKVSGPGTLTFRTAIHPIAGPIAMFNTYLGVLPVNWPSAGEVGSFTVTQLVKPRGNVNCDEQVNVADIVYVISYLFKGGPTPNPLENGDVNCDGQVTVSDVIYLINYLFKGGPPPPC